VLPAELIVEKDWFGEALEIMNQQEDAKGLADALIKGAK